MKNLKRLKNFLTGQQAEEDEKKESTEETKTPETIEETGDKTEDSVIVKIVLPGIKKEDIETNLTETKLHVKATFDFEQAFKGIYFTLSDIKKGNIERVIRLPEKVIPEKAKASFKNGILTVEAPKLEKEEKITLKIE